MNSLSNITHRVRAEFIEMPGLRLKSEQVQRLCGIDAGVCGSVLRALVTANFLCVKSDGHYARVTDDDVSRPRSAKADLGVDTWTKKAS
jgi:hypothetical protein